MFKLVQLVLVISMLMSSTSTTNSHVLVNEKKAVIGEQKQVYIVYRGAANDVRTLSSNLAVDDDHNFYLTIKSILGSKEALEESLVYTYRHGFSGFAAKLTPSQAQKISELPGVVKVMPNRVYQLQTTRSWDFLGLLASYDDVNNQYLPISDLLTRANLGEGVIIGIFDSGIWPESKSFNDEGLGPVPSRWRGTCQSGEKFDPKTCNRKLIGAKFYKSRDSFGEVKEYLSPRDSNGHGTHVASTAAGSFIPDASYKGVLAPGIARGGAPRARIAVYKVCWQGSCAQADILKAFDDAISDGVDLISCSIADPTLPVHTLFDEEGAGSAISMGAFHAVSRGIPVVAAAGNNGPHASTVNQIAPWIISVAASTVDRVFDIPITLGNETFLGQAMSTINKTMISAPLYDIGVRFTNDNAAIIAGEVAFCFTTTDNNQIDDFSIRDSITYLIEKKGAGLIMAKNPSDSLSTDCSFRPVPCVEVDVKTGTKIESYLSSFDSDPVVTIGQTKTVVGRPLTPKIAHFSSRGPNSVSPAILKPDVAAPGVNILAQMSPMNNATDSKGFAFLSGTSMATPHVAGIIALLRALHSDWSPAAIRSALVTTATTDVSGGPIFANGEPRKIADPFDFGGGIVNPNGAADPGLVYDMGTPVDYILYLCAMGYKDSQISLVMGKPTVCPSEPHASLLNVNLPSITIPRLINSTIVSVSRTVTNVGPIFSTYWVMVEKPLGIQVEVIPHILLFSTLYRQLTFTVNFYSEHEVNDEAFYFGSLSWTDGVHVVRIPLSVLRQVGE